MSDLLLRRAAAQLVEQPDRLRGLFFQASTDRHEVFLRELPALEVDLRVSERKEVAALRLDEAAAAEALALWEEMGAALDADEVRG